VTATPANERIDATSRAESASRSGSRPGRRAASMLLPAPGGPTMRRWWPPAAATTSASTASTLPMTSARSSSAGTAGSDRDLVMASTGSGSRSAPCQIAASRRLGTATTRMPGTRAASSALSVGTMTVVAPARRAPSTAGRTPSTGRSRPSRPSSPRCTTRSTESAGTSSAAASAAMAMPRSNDDPCLGSDAGDRLTVSLRAGRAHPELVAAERTRSRASPRDVSGRPMITNAGSPAPMSASISTRAPSTPSKATALVRATLMLRPRARGRCARAPRTARP
jgi:hypothetical protein